MTLRNQYAAKALEKSRTVSAKNILVSIVVGLALALTGCLPRQPNVVMPVAPLVTKQGFDYNSVALTPRPPRPKKSSTDKNLHRLSEGLMPAYRHPEWVPTVKERRWAWIVVHHSATRRGSALIFGRFHRENRRWDELGYHFVIGNGFGSNDGQIEAGSRWRKQKHGAHCKVPMHDEYNQVGIGICLVGDFTRSRPTAKQKKALAELVRWLVWRYRIRNSRVIRHSDVKDTVCPGSGFPFDDFHRDVFGKVR